jgi:hypothetical protein
MRRTPKNFVFRTFKFIKCFCKGEQLFQLNVLRYRFALIFHFHKTDDLFWTELMQYFIRILVSCCMKSSKLKLGWREFVHRACTSLNREYSMIYRGPGFLAHLSREQVFHSQSYCVSPAELTDGRGGGRCAKSYNREKALPSINYSIGSDLNPFR